MRRGWVADTTCASKLQFLLSLFQFLFFFFILSGVFHWSCTNNAQAPSLFSNVTLTSRRNMRLLVSVTLEKREGACALFVQKTPDMFTNLPSARKTLLDPSFILFYFFVTQVRQVKVVFLRTLRSAATRLWMDGRESCRSQQNTLKVRSSCESAWLARTNIKAAHTGMHTQQQVVNWANIEKRNQINTKNYWK